MGKTKMNIQKKRILSIQLLAFIAILTCCVSAQSSPLLKVASESKSPLVTEKEEKQEKQIIKEEAATTNSSFFNTWLHILDSNAADTNENVSVLSHAKNVPSDIGQAFSSLDQNGRSTGFFGVLIRSVFALGCGLVVAFFANRLVTKYIRRIEKDKPHETDVVTKLLVGVMHNAGSIVSLFFLAMTSILVFLLIAEEVSTGGRMLFLALLGSLLIVKVLNSLSNFILAPNTPDIRMVSLSETLIQPLHQAVVISASTLIVGILLARLLGGLGVQWQTISWVAVVLGSAIIVTFCFFILQLRTPVCNLLLEQTKERENLWVKEQLSQYWHVPALCYLFIVWIFWVGQLLSGVKVQASTFTVSVIAIPIYLALNSLGKLLIGSVVDSLGLARVEADPERGIDEEEAERQQSEKRTSIVTKTQTIYSILLGITIFTWLLSLWGIDLPFAQYAMRALFESLIAVGLALICWHFTSSYIEKKIAEATPEEEEKTEDVDDEFGGAAPRGRSHTLLPMLRKVIGTVLMTMVVLIVISSLGVNIGPLLAGAGIVGLAIGFGAQKLVSDVLSGFFFLLDDAFRIGEYIQAGSIRGTVEAITLRNVMLRHHLGMLQVVPHSDLGAVTNYMRGGIVIKFPLEFPYDTDIEKVRKIIKKVGQAMIANEELGDDFIQPVKSQGVYEITNSVMVIRVKFTAKPGKQFVIKREAFRRITEALNAKGIYYAHRKVIVDLPEDSKARELDETTQKKLLEAGAASALASESSQQNLNQKKTVDPME